MLNPFSDYWLTRSADQQDIIILAILLAIPSVIACLLFFRQAPFLLIKAMMVRFAYINLAFISLIGISVAMSLSLTAQERGLREASAKAAGNFDLIVTSPGGKVSALMSVVYLQKNEMPLLNGEIYHKIFQHPQVEMAAPLAFGDSYQGAVIVGTTADFIEHLAKGELAGKLFESEQQAVIGFSTQLSIGDFFSPEHVSAKQLKLSVRNVDHHKDHSYKIVGKMPYTGTPWDKAILVPIEGVWSVHSIGRANLDKEEDHERENKLTKLGPPFSANGFHGAQAVVIKAKKLMANYALKREFTTTSSMAFFPGSVLSELHRIIGDVQKLISILGIVTQVLVVISVMTSFVILNRLFSKHIAMLSAVGAPKRYIYAVIWGYAASLISLGAIVGLLIAVFLTKTISAYISSEININIEATLNWQEWHLLAIFCAGSAVFALIPPLISLRAPVLEQLRQ